MEKQNRDSFSGSYRALENSVRELLERFKAPLGNEAEMAESIYLAGVGTLEGAEAAVEQVTVDPLKLSDELLWLLNFMRHSSALLGLPNLDRLADGGAQIVVSVGRQLAAKIFQRPGSIAVFTLTNPCEIRVFNAAMRVANQVSSMRNAKMVEGEV